VGTGGGGGEDLTFEKREKGVCEYTFRQKRKGEFKAMEKGEGIREGFFRNRVDVNL